MDAHDPYGPKTHDTLHMISQDAQEDSSEKGLKFMMIKKEMIEESNS